jgi:pimeloyl-ACP methyl ester carboxylesterase
MPRFSSYDGTVIAYREVGSGPLLVCVPGGPARASVYCGDLGGLDTHRTLLFLDNRGSGESGDCDHDPDSYRADRLADDVEALRAHLGLETFDLLGHSGGAQIALWYAAAHPARLASLTLLNGGHGTAGVEIEGGLAEAVGRRRGEPWFAEAAKALDEWSQIGRHAPAELKRKAAPFFYGPWTPAAEAHADSDPGQRRNPLASQHFPHLPQDPAALRRSLAAVSAPVLVYTGELDPGQRPVEAEALAAVFPRGRVVVQPGAGHFPWLDDPASFVKALIPAGTSAPPRPLPDDAPGSSVPSPQ